MNSEINVAISPCPKGLEKEYYAIFTEGSLEFLAEMNTEFEDKIQQLYIQRSYRKEYYQKYNETPKFKNSECKNIQWKIAEIPKRLRNRKIDLGDVSPSNTYQFLNSLNQNVQGIQVDFDDGHCPNWYNQILGHYNIYSVVHDKSRNLNNIPIMMLRPRAWNMKEHNVSVNRKKLPGSLVDFGLLMYHNALILCRNESGPYFYLSKLESSSEAKLWNEIFAWTQQKLNLPYGTIKCCVLIENILATFELSEILYELKDHCIGLNCGMWDYIASIIAKFGNRKGFVLKDRQKLSMQDRFLKTYMELIIQTCHKRGALATGGMIAKVSSDQNSLTQIYQTKRFEIISGIDGFLIYDTNLLPCINKLWDERCNIISTNIEENSKTELDLLTLPGGVVTWHSLIHNIQVTMLFIYYWLHGIGHFVHNGFVEDSATAEISRSQIWQWIKLETPIILKNNKSVTIVPQLVEKEVKNFRTQSDLELNILKMELSANVAMELFLAPKFPSFITTYLNDHHLLSMKYEPAKPKL